MEIYLDANATTPVCPAAQAAAMAVMAHGFGNPSSIHGSGLKARAVLEEARASARRVLGATTGQLCFTSGATEGIQTAVLSALSALRRRRDAGESRVQTLLYGATEHKAVPEALKHWNALLGLHLPIVAIPVGRDGRHDLTWLRAQAPSAGLVCTMAANNETGVISDLDGIAQALVGSLALWLVDGVQALGKLSLKLDERRIDYAPFSGHKFYAPKGIGLLYVREGAPFTPLLTGGGQESALRGGTENMAGIAALGAVLNAWEGGSTFQPPAALVQHRARLADALRDAFAGLVFNAPDDLSLPTTLNFAVPGLSAKLLLDLFDAARLRVSGGSACSAAKAMPSYVLQAMGLPAWQTEAAVRLSFGALDTPALIDEACQRIRACGDALRANGLTQESASAAAAPDLITRFVSGTACSYVLVDAEVGECVVVDPAPELTERVTRWLRCRSLAPAAVLCTTHDEASASAAQTLRETFEVAGEGCVDALGWPTGAASVAVGGRRLVRLSLTERPFHANGYVLYEDKTPAYALVGTVVERAASGDLGGVPALQALARGVGLDTLLLPRHDSTGCGATTLRVACAEQPHLASLLALTPANPAPCWTAGESLDRCAVSALLRSDPRALLVDVREAYERDLQAQGPLAARSEAVPLSSLACALPRWLALAQDVPVLFYCRSGNRSAQAARALRRLGHAQAWNLAGGLALWTDPTVAPARERADALTAREPG